MSIFYVKLATIALFLFSVGCSAESRDCEGDLLDTYVAYKQALSANERTIYFFKLKYLSEEMAREGIEKSEHGERLAKYTYTLDAIQSDVRSVTGVYSKCNAEYGHLLLKVNVKNKVVEKYISIRFLDRKIINISKEELSVVNKEYNNPIFSEVDIEFSL